jgi:hypothetical protein
MGRNWHEMKPTLTASCREYWGFFYQLDISWVLAHIITESFSCFQKCNRKVWSAELSARNLGQIILYLSRCPWSSSWPDRSQWVVMAAHWSLLFHREGDGLTLLGAILIRLWLNSLPCQATRIVITVLKWSDSHNEGEKESFIWEVQTLGSICILKENQHMLAYEYMWNSSLQKWLFSIWQQASTAFGLAQTIIMGIAQGVT